MILHNDLLVLCTIIPASVLFIISLVLSIILYAQVHHCVPIFTFPVNAPVDSAIEL